MISTTTPTTKKYAPVSYRSKPQVVKEECVPAMDTTNLTAVQRRTALFEELSALKNQLPKPIAIKKGWTPDMKAAQGSKYGKKTVGFSTLPLKKTLAELP